MESISDFGGISGFLATAVVLYIASQPVYALFLNPLTSYPGPLLWRAFRWPQLWAMMAGTLPFKLEELHDRYGPVVRIAPNELSFVDPAAWKDIYGKGHLIRPPQWRNRLPNKNSDHFISADVETHTRFRKAFSPAFSEQALRKQEILMQNYITKFLGRCEEAMDSSGLGVGTVNLIQLFNFLAFDIIGDLGWGKSFECLDKMQYHPWVEVVLHFKMTMLVAALKYYPLIDKLVAIITPPSALKSIKMITTTAEENVKSRLGMQGDRPDIISHVIKQNARPDDDSPQLSTEEIETNSVAFIVAGSDTMTSALAATINCLLELPSSAARLTAEVRDAFATEEDIDSVSTNRLPYLTAVIEESLRMCPPVPDIMRRQVAGGDISVASHQVPNGTVVGIPQWAMFHSSLNFELLNQFAPERWLEDPAAQPKFRGDGKSAFKPFSMGPTGCIGHNLARMELRIILARFIWRFNFDMPKGRESLQWSKQKIWWSWSKEALFVALSRA